jgi:hypothetical protein
VYQREEKDPLLVIQTWQ